MRSSSMGGASSCCQHHHALCQSVARLSTVGCYVHEPCPGDDGSVYLGRSGLAGSVGSSLSSVTDCSGSRHAQSCNCDDRDPAEHDRGGADPDPSSTVAPTPRSNRICVVQGLVRGNDDAGLAIEVKSHQILFSFFWSIRVWVFPGSIRTVFFCANKPPF